MKKELGITKGGLKAEEILAKIIQREEPLWSFEETFDAINKKDDEYREPWVDVALEAMDTFSNEKNRELLERYNEAIEVLSEFMKYHESDFFKLIADDGRVKGSWILKAEQTISKANRG